MVKPKILIRYPGGSGGSFLCMILTALVHPVQVSQHFNGHDDLGRYAGRYHNFHEHLRIPGFQHSFNIPDSTNSELGNLLQNRFEFRPTFLPFYVMHSHIIRADAVALAWPETKIVKITTTQLDLDQVAYNWVCKFLTRFKHRDVLAGKLATVQREYQRLATVSVEQFGELDCPDDIKLLTWINRYASHSFYQGFEQYQPQVPEIEISFRSLFHGTLANSIELVAKDLGIVYTEQGLTRAQDLIAKYSASQHTVPWKLTLKDYE